MRPDDGQGLYQYLRDKGYNQQELDASGLFKRSQSGRILLPVLEAG